MRIGAIYCKRSSGSSIVLFIPPGWTKDAKDDLSHKEASAGLRGHHDYSW